MNEVRWIRERLDVLDLLERAGYDASQVHPLCYKDFSHVRFTEEVIADCLALARKDTPVTRPDRTSPHD